jgi:hypothetical protein
LATISSGWCLLRGITVLQRWPKPYLRMDHLAGGGSKAKTEALSKEDSVPRAKGRVAAKGGKTDREAETSGQHMDPPAVLEQNRRRAVEGLLASSAKGGTAPKAVDVTAQSPPAPTADVARRLFEVMGDEVASPAPAVDVAAEAVKAINAPIAPLQLKRHIPEFDGPLVAQPKRKPRKKAD